MTGSLLAIDSGHPRCAAAEATDGELRWVTSIPVDPSDYVVEWLCPKYDRVVVEIPTMRGNATPNPESLILIAVAGARLAERFARDPAEIIQLRPSQWKGNTPKPAHHRRMWNALTPAERTLLGGARTLGAIDIACLRGAKDLWSKPGATYYRARELPTVGGKNGTKITHDILDAAALALYALGRIGRG